MVFEHIDKLKEEYTDQYVTVEDGRPELARFRGLVGRVKTVNMSGRALVEFGEWINNIGWYDIDVDFLKVVEKSEAEAKAEAAKAEPKKATAPAKAPSKLEKSRATAGKATGAAMNTADILAAARGKTAPESKEEKPVAAAKGEARPAEKSGGQMSVADMLAAARSVDGGAGAAPAKEPQAKKETAPAPAKEPAKSEAKPAAKKSAAVDTTGMSVEEMLALARAQASGEAPAEPAQQEAPPAKEESADPPAAEEPVAEAEPEAPAEEEAPAAKSAEVGELPKDIPGILEFCRQTDG